MKPFILILLILMAFGSQAEGATGCSYPAALDTFNDLTTGTVVTAADWNKQNCASEKVEAEAGQDPAGTFGTIVQRLDDVDVRIAGKVLAEMADCENNWVGIPQDGDVCYDTAIERLVYFDNSTSEWRCTKEAHGVIDIACPPYNADPSAADNATAISAAITQLIAIVDAGNTINAYIYVPPGVFTVLSALLYDRTGTTGRFVMTGAGSAISQILFNFTGTYGLSVRNGVGGPSNVGNNVWLQGVSFRSGTNKPDSQLYLDNMTQNYLRDVTFGDYDLHGVSVIGGAHTNITDFGCFLRADVGRADGGCIHLSNVSEARVLSGYGEPNAGPSTNGSVVLLSGFSAIRRIEIASVKVDGAWYGIRQINAAASSRNLHIHHNTFKSIGKTGILTVSTDTEGLHIHNNGLNHIGSSVTGDYGIQVRQVGSVSSADIYQNEIDGFYDGMRLQTLTNTSVRYNTFRNIVNDCITDLSSAEGNVFEGNKIFDTCPGSVLNVTSTATTGSNVFKNFIFGDTASKAAGVTRSGTFAVDDKILFADPTQTTVIADDTVGASVATATITPHYYDLLIDCNDPDGCDTKLIDGASAYPMEGMRVAVRLAASPGTTNRISGDDGVSWTTITDNDVHIYQRQNSNWVKIN